MPPSCSSTAPVRTEMPVNQSPARSRIERSKSARVGVSPVLLRRAGRVSASACGGGGGGWVSLSGEDEAVRKRVLQQGSGSSPTAGATVEIRYTGRIAENSWSSRDVVECWLAEQQGLEALRALWIEKDINGGRLEDEAFFTADFVAQELGLSSKIQCKKLVMAARRLVKERADHPVGSTFDSTEGRDAYAFILGNEKVIRGMDLAVVSMTVGEKAEVTCRSDYAYGKDGLRSSKGDVMVPPFATLCFELQLVGAS